MEDKRAGIGTKPVRVLIADDDPVMRSLVVANLADRVDTIVEAADGQQAWDLLLGRTFELAMIDLSMPGIDGYTLIRCMRSHPRTCHMPIMVITSSVDQDAVARAFEAGATAFLTKPINWTLFGHHIDYLIRLSHGSAVERATKQRAEAVVRAKDAVIATLAGRMRGHAGRMSDTAEAELRRLAGLAEGTEHLGFAATMLAEALAIQEMLDVMLPHVRSMTEQIVVDDRPVRLLRLVTGCIAEVSQLARSRDVEIEVGRLDEQLIVRCDERAIARAFVNLLHNAVEFTRTGTSVLIHAEVRSDNVLALCVEDQGPGADPVVIAHSLAPLDQWEASGLDRHQQATLGLPMAKAIAQAHGGTVEVIALPDGGTLASLILPSEIVELPDDE